MKGVRIPEHILNPDDNILYSIGCKDDGTYLESALLISKHYAYVVGNFTVLEEERTTNVIKGFKVIDLKSVFDVKEITTRYSFLITLSMIFSLILILFFTGHARVPLIDPLPFYLYETVMSLVAVGTLILYITLRKKFILLRIKGGRVQFRERVNDPGAVRKVQEIILKQNRINLSV